MKDILIDALEDEIVKLKRRRRFIPKWAPGDLEDESSVTGSLQEIGTRTGQERREVGQG